MSSRSSLLRLLTLGNTLAPLVLLILNLLILVLIPPATEHVLESILERTTVHVNQPFLLFGLWMTKHGDKTKIPIDVSTELEVELTKHVLVHFHKMDHSLIM